MPTRIYERLSVYNHGTKYGINRIQGSKKLDNLGETYDFAFRSKPYYLRTIRCPKASSQQVKVTNKKFRQLPVLVTTALAGLLVASPGFAQDVLGGSRPSTVLPTDTVPLPLPAERQALGESLKMRLFQKLPARFYFSGTVESSFRIETNVFQFPSRSALLRKFAPDGLQSLSPENAQAVQGLLDNAYREDCVFRVTPNVTAGWALTPNTRVYGNYYFFRDQLFRNNVLSTSINQYAVGIEHSRLIPKTRVQYELQFQGRELLQSGTDPVFDYIPSITLSMPLTKSYNWVAYFNGLLQLRSTKFACLPDRSITPFYTFGLAHTKGRWSFSANATMLNTYQKGFSQARSDINSGAWICDFEIARQIVDRLPGFQAFVRCEPVFNFGGRNNPGLSGNDVRIFFGLRMSAYKPALLATINQLKQHYQPQEQPKQKRKGEPDVEPPPPTEQKNSDPGSTSMADPSDDLSLITLNSDPTPQAEETSYPPLALKPVDVEAVDQIAQSLNGDQAQAMALADSAPEDAATDASQESYNSNQFSTEPSQADLNPTPTAAPMHGFIDHKVDSGSTPEFDSTKISSIPDLNPIK